MKHFYFKFFAFVLVTSFISSCQDDTVVTTPLKYKDGVIVVNQGKFQGGTGTLTYLSNETKAVSQDIFGIENTGEPLGNIAQSIIKFGSRYFIAINNANKIVVTDLDFKKKGVISDVELPRYFAIASNKLYLSAYGADFMSGRVYQIDTALLTIKSTIAVGNAPEQMLAVNDKLYVTLSSPYGGDSEDVAVINTTTNIVESKIKTSDSPTAITQDKNGDIWVLCTGNYAFNPVENTAGALVKINNGVVTLNLPLSNGASQLVPNKDGSKLYFNSGGKVLVQDIASSTVTTQSLLSGYFFALHFDQKTNTLFATDAKDFSSNGELIGLNLTNNQSTKYTTGIGPGFVYSIE